MDSRVQVLMRVMKWRASTDDAGGRKVGGVTTVYFCGREKWVPVQAWQG